MGKSHGTSGSTNFGKPFRRNDQSRDIHPTANVPFLILIALSTCHLEAIT
jgi:hypothetical protein